MKLYNRMLEAAGTARAAAALLGLKEQAVYKWRTRGIPVRHKIKVRRLIQERTQA